MYAHWFADLTNKAMLKAEKQNCRSYTAYRDMLGGGMKMGKNNKNFRQNFLTFISEVVGPQRNERVPRRLGYHVLHE